MDLRHGPDRGGRHAAMRPHPTERCRTDPRLPWVFASVVEHPQQSRLRAEESVPRLRSCIFLNRENRLYQLALRHEKQSTDQGAHEHPCASHGVLPRTGRDDRRNSGDDGEHDENPACNSAGRAQ